MRKSDIPKRTLPYCSFLDNILALFHCQWLAYSWTCMAINNGFYNFRLLLNIQEAQTKKERKKIGGKVRTK